MNKDPYKPFFSEAELNVARADQQAKDKLLLLVTYILNPIRLRFGPVAVTSGYRTPEHNKGLGSMGYHPSNTSQHCLGEAADFVIHGVNMMEVYEWIKANLQVGELFYYKKRGHIHVSLTNYNLASTGKLNIAILDE